jgi:hypothetical protein
VEKSSWDEPFGDPLKNALKTLAKNQQLDFGISVDDGHPGLGNRVLRFPVQRS